LVDRSNIVVVTATLSSAVSWLYTRLPVSFGGCVFRSDGKGDVVSPQAIWHSEIAFLETPHHSGSINSSPQPFNSALVSSGALAGMGFIWDSSGIQLGFNFRARDSAF